MNVRTEAGQAVRLYDKSYALVIGVSNYTAGWPSLPGVGRDVEEVAKALEKHGFQVTSVSDPDAARLGKAFKDFINAHGANPDDRLLFYFAGHGHTLKRSFGEEMGYLVPADAPDPGADRAGFLAKAIDMQEIEVYAHRIETRHALFLFDSCFSGSIFALKRAIPANISYKTSLPVRQFITSGSADEQVPDRSIFREQFVAALEGEADRDRDGYVTGTELGMFLQDKVIIYSRGSQHPQYGTLRDPKLDKGDLVFALSNAAPRAPKTAERPAAPAPAPQAEAEPSDLYEREALILLGADFPGRSVLRGMIKSIKAAETRPGSLLGKRFVINGTLKKSDHYGYGYESDTHRSYQMRDASGRTAYVYVPKDSAFAMSLRRLSALQAMDAGPDDDAATERESKLACMVVIPDGRALKARSLHAELVGCVEPF